MKRLSVISLLLLALTVAPFANALQCSGYVCRVGNCPWFELLGDTGFAYPTCNVWNYTGTGTRGYGSVCNSNTYFGQLNASQFLHGATVAQAFNTNNGANDLDNFSFQYTIETSGMSAGDYVKVYINDNNTATHMLVDTITADYWCNNVSHSYNNAGWKGHSLSVKFESYIASTSTTVKVTGVTFWQQFQ